VPKAVRLLAVGLGVFVVGAALSLGAVAYAHRQRFYPGVKVAGIDLSGRTQQEGRALVDEKVRQYLSRPVRVVVPDITKPVTSSADQYADLELPTTAGQLGLGFQEDEALSAAWQTGHQRTLSPWLRAVVPILFSGRTQNLGYQIDPKAIATYVGTQVLPKIGGPVPAKLVIDGAVVRVDPPQAGLQLDQTALSHMLSTALSTPTDGDTAYLRAPVKQVESSVSENSLLPLANRLNVLGNLKLSLSGGGVALTPTRQQLLSWVAPVQDAKGAVSVVLQQDAIAKFLGQTDALDQAASLQKVVDKLGPLLAASDSTDAVPATLAVAIVGKPLPAAPAVAKTYTLGKFSQKYVEVNLKDQRLYLIDGTTLVKAYIVSTGYWSTPTPEGTFTIHDKSPRAYSAEFGLYMPYWEDFLNGEYGLHELPEWPNGYKEGQDHLGVPVSHGCVRLGVGDAKEVYDWTEIGTPVYIHS
jgi:lipoprotein-anchoring transpeptidase ErfK/SrfK